MKKRSFTFGSLSNSFEASSVVKMSLFFLKNQRFEPVRGNTVCPTKTASFRTQLMILFNMTHCIHNMNIW